MNADRKAAKNEYFYTNNQNSLNMKKILLILVLTLAAALPSQARKADINRSGDTTTIVMNGDTVRVTDGEVTKAINKAINDTLWSETAKTEDDETYNYMALDNDARLKEVSMWSSTVKQISITMCFCIMVVVFLSLLFYLLHRRAKYRVIEKAIENNYPLPPSLGGTPTYKQAPQRPDAWRNYAPQQPQPQQSQQPQPQSQWPQAQAQPQQAPYQQGMNAPMQPNMPYRVNYMAYKKSFVLVTVGLMAAMFFESAGASPMVFLSMIVMLLGLGKGFVIYKEQKQYQDYWQWQMQQQQQVPQQPQQNAEQQPPVFTPPTENN